MRLRRLIRVKEGLDSLQRNLGIGASGQPVPRSSSDTASLENVTKGLGVGGPQRG